MTLRDLDCRHKVAALNVLCAAFHDYPAIADPEYERGLMIDR